MTEAPSSCQGLSLENVSVPAKKVNVADQQDDVNGIEESALERGLVDVKLSPLEWGAKYLHDNYVKHIGRFHATADCSRRVAMERVHASAALSLIAQRQACEKFFKLVQDMAAQGQWEPITLLEHQFHDETRLRLRMRTAKEESGDLECARVFAVETKFSALLRRVPASWMSAAAAKEGGHEHCIVELPLSVQVRGSVDATAESIASVLSSCFQLPHGAAEVFQNKIRLLECDECSANLKAEQILLAEWSSRWMSFPSVCLCHKIHSGATKSWTLEQGIITSLVQTTLHVGMGGTMQHLKAAVTAVVDQKLVILREPLLHAGAEEYKQRVLKYFRVSPKQHKAQAVVEVATRFFNSEWRQNDCIYHVCPGESCCLSLQDSRQKAKLLIKKLLTSLRPKVFSKADWLTWASSLPFFWNLDEYPQHLATGVPHSLFTGAERERLCTWRHTWDMASRGRRDAVTCCRCTTCCHVI